MLMTTATQKQYPHLTSFVFGELSKVPFKKPKVFTAFLKWSELTTGQAITALTKCSNPVLEIMVMPGSNGKFRGSTKPNTIYLAKAVADRFEVDHAKPEAKLLVESTILHEMVHWGDWKDGEDQEPEEGKEFEKEAYGKDINRYW